MLPATTALPDSPTPRPNDQPLDPLTAIVSGTAGTWHPGHAPYCLWRWARLRWQHTREWTATWRFHLDSQQQLEAIPQRKRTTETPTATNLCPVFPIRQIRALALGQQLQPAIPTETEPRRHSGICERNAQCPPRRPRAARGKPPRALHHREPKPGTNPHEHAWQHRQDHPAPADAAHACPANRSRSRAVQRQHTAVHARRESCTGRPQVRRRYGGPRITSSRRETRREVSNQRLRNQPSTATTSGEPTLPKRTPSHNPTTHDPATHSTKACWSGTPAEKASTCPTHATDSQRIWASSSGPLCRTPGLVPNGVHERVPSANAYRLVLIPHSTCAVLRWCRRQAPHCSTRAR